MRRSILAMLCCIFLMGCAHTAVKEEGTNNTRWRFADGGRKHLVHRVPGRVEWYTP